MLKRFFALTCLLIFSALALVACGSSGEDSQIEEAIETSATSTDPADCTKLETQQFMEQTTQESGKAAVVKCEEEAKAEEGAESVSVSNVEEVSDSSATAEAALTGGALNGQALEVELVKNGDQWQLNEVVKFTEFDRAKLVEFVEEEFTPSANGLSPKLAGCFVEAFQEGSQADIEELLWSGSGEGFEEIAEACQ